MQHNRKKRVSEDDINNSHIIEDSKLPTMLKLLDWAQTQLETRLHFPKIVDYANATFE